MRKAKVVIGANFGDEGKGLMTDYYAAQAVRNGERCIVVLSNGGAQRGHTVELENGARHVFHHFGSGTFRGADSYYPKEYILNPLVYWDEYDELVQMGYTPISFVNEACLVTTPYDMMINQIFEEHRGGKKHGSCGLGIWETVVRNGLKAREMYELGKEGVKEYLKDIRNNYMLPRLATEGIDSLPQEWEDAVYSEKIIDGYTDSFFQMIEAMNGFVPDQILYNYDTIIFENGQGLLLDWDMKKEYGNHITASYTGLKNPARIIRETFDAKIPTEVCYVTRTYMTRHGAGRFDSECPKELINPDMVDKTNVPNPHQGTIRYGTLDVKKMMEVCQADFDKINLQNATIKYAVTHINEYKISELDQFDYRSDCSYGKIHSYRDSFREV